MSEMVCPQCQQRFEVQDQPGVPLAAVMCPNCRTTALQPGRAAGDMPGAGVLPLAYAAPVPGTSGLAITGFVLGICSLMLSILTGIPAIICSAIALRQTGPGKRGGRGLAIAGLVLGIIGTVVHIALIGAAIIIPQFSNASNDARASAAMSTTQSLQAQLELYKLQHNDSYPTLREMSGFSVLVQTTDASGVASPSGRYGPYLQAPPVNPFTGSSQVVSIQSPVSSAGWAYDPTNGKILPILPAKQVGNVSSGGTGFLIAP